MFIDSTYNLLYIDFGEGFYPVACLTENGFSESIETLDTTTRDNTGWKTQVLTTQSYEISFSGLVINTVFAKGDFTKISYDKLKELKRNRTLFDWKIQDNELQFIESGQGQITSLSSTSSIDEFVSFEGTIIGYGVPSSTSGKEYILQDGEDNNIQDGNNNDIITA